MHKIPKRLDFIVFSSRGKKCSPLQSSSQTPLNDIPAIFDRNICCTRRNEAHMYELSVVLQYINHSLHSRLGSVIQT